MTGWLKDVDPSSELRKEFHAYPEDWKIFESKYKGELSKKHKALEPILKALIEGPVTLLYGAKDPLHNHALILQNYINHLKKH